MPTQTTRWPRYTPGPAGKVNRNPTWGRLARSLAALVVLSLSAVLAASPLSTAKAAGVAGSGECVVTLTLYLDSNLVKGPALSSITFGFADGAGTCRSANHIKAYAMDFSGGGSLAIGSSCTALPGIAGSAALSIAVPTTVFDGAGVMASQIWSFTAVGGLGDFTAVSQFAWLDEMEIANCYTNGGTASISLTGVIAFQQ